MKRLYLVILIAVMLAAGACQKKEETVVLDSKVKKQSYMFGLSIGQQMKDSRETVDLDALIKGFRDSYTGGEKLLTDEEHKQIAQEYQQERRQRMMAMNKEQIEMNKKEEEEFLQKNAGNSDVKTTESGLQYMVVTMGKGPKPQATDKVKVHYKGTFVDGKVFDSSYDRNQPAEFPLNGVIPGWTEGLQLMNTGSKFMFFIPSKLAYGDQGRPPDMPPAKMLIFEVELLEILK